MQLLFQHCASLLTWWYLPHHSVFVIFSCTFFLSFLITLTFFQLFKIVTLFLLHHQYFSSEHVPTVTFLFTFFSSFLVSSKPIVCICFWPIPLSIYSFMHIGLWCICLSFVRLSHRDKLAAGLYHLSAS